MKLVIAVIQDKDSQQLSDELNKANLRATKLSTTGGFLKSGNTTFLIGVEDERVPDVLEIIKDVGKARQQYLSLPVTFDVDVESSLAHPVEIEIGGATVFVVPVEGFYHY